MSKLPTIGQMIHTLTFDKPTKSSDDTGGQNEVYENWFTCRGHMRKMSGARAFNSGYDETVNVYVCYLPWRNAIETEISKDVRVTFESRPFSIEHFNRVDEDRKLFRLELKEIR